MAEKDDKMARNKKSRKGFTLEEKEAMMRDFIGIDEKGRPTVDENGKPFYKYEGLKINREHLKMLLDKYGGYSYDIMQFANLNPKRLMDSVIKGHESELAENPIVQEFMANRNSMTPDKALEFFAEFPKSDFMLANVFESAGKENLAKEIRYEAYIARYGVKQSGGQSLQANQRKLEGRMGAQADKKAKEQKAKGTTPVVRQAGGAEME